MKNVERIGVSLEKSLLSKFDKAIDAQGYQSRSEAIRDLIRESLAEKKLEHSESEAVGSVCIVYDHHETKVMKKLTGLQHSHFVHVICSTHVHLDHHNCMEVIILKGAVGKIEKLAEEIRSLKGVKLGSVNLIAN